MELTVKQVREALSKCKDDEIVYTEGCFGGSDILTAYDVKVLESGRVIIATDGHLSEDDREGTEFGFEIGEKSLIYGDK